MNVEQHVVFGLFMLQIKLSWNAYYIECVRRIGHSSTQLFLFSGL